MGLDTIIGNFMKGLGSTIFKIGALQGILSSAIAGGVEGGVKRAMPHIMKNMVLGAILLTGIFLLGLGIAKWADFMLAIPGLGFILTGFILMAAGSLYLSSNSREA